MNADDSVRSIKGVKKEFTNLLCNFYLKLRSINIYIEVRIELEGHIKSCVYLFIISYLKLVKD